VILISDLFSGKLWVVKWNPEEQAPEMEGQTTLAQTTRPDEPPPVRRSEPVSLPTELGGRDGPEPTRYGDWELRGRCIDF
jgi:hypothetical protein